MSNFGDTHLVMLCAPAKRFFVVSCDAIGILMFVMGRCTVVLAARRVVSREVALAAFVLSNLHEQLMCFRCLFVLSFFRNIHKVAHRLGSCLLCTSSWWCRECGYYW
jgi:hypothetical protein